MARSCTPHNSSGLTILGVIHRDTEAVPLLGRWLEVLQPEVITLEFSEFGLKYRETEGQAQKQKVRAVADDMASRGQKVDRQSLDAVLAYLEPSFEFAVAAEYTRLHGRPLYLIDDDRFSRPKLAMTDALISTGNLEILLSAPPQDDCRRQRVLAGLCLDKGVDIWRYDEEMEARDREMRDRIRSLMLRHRNARLLHICGWQHLRDPQGIYDPLSPTRVFIYDKAVCV